MATKQLADLKLRAANGGIQIYCAVLGIEKKQIPVGRAFVGIPQEKAQAVLDAEQDEFTLDRDLIGRAVVVCGSDAQAWDIERALVQSLLAKPVISPGIVNK